MTDQLFDWLHANSSLALFVVPTLAFGEALVGLGLLISGAILLSVCTLLYIEGLASLSQMLPLAFAGAFVADHIGYYAGRQVGPVLLATSFARRHESKTTRALNLVQRYGGFAVVIGRLLTMVRSLVPLVIGTSDMKPLRFTCYDLLACAVWTTGLGLLVTGLDAVAS